MKAFGTVALGVILVALAQCVAGASSTSPPSIGGANSKSPGEIDFATLFADRTAIERVYHEHRLGTKPAFDEVLPASAIHELVRQDLRKAAVLRDVYGVEITSDAIDAEIKRIEATTRAPDLLADLRKALGNDPARFARSVVHPLLVERELRGRFQADERWHAAQRKEAEAVRERLLAAKDAGATVEKLSALLTNKVGTTTERTWELGAEQAAKANGGPYSIEATARVMGREEPKDTFSQLPPDLGKVMLAQLRKGGDVSAVIETPSAFVVMLAKETSETRLRTGEISIPKRHYEEWLSEQ